MLVVMCAYPLYFLLVGFLNQIKANLGELSFSLISEPGAQLGGLTLLSLLLLFLFLLLRFPLILHLPSPLPLCSSVLYSSNIPGLIVCINKR